MVELKSLIALLPFLFSYLASAEPEANPEPQWWDGGNSNGNKQQDGKQSGQSTGGWGNPYQPYQNTPFQQDPRPGSNPFQNGQPNIAPTPTTNQPTPTTPTHDPDDDEPSNPRWTPPPNWGPRTTPFGPTTPQTPLITPPAPTPPQQPPPPPPPPKPTGTRPDYCTNPDLICTTTGQGPKEPIPYAVTCGKTRFNEYDVSNALNTGCYWFKKGTTIAGTEFPRVFDNEAGRFDFGVVKAPFWEFPLIESAGFVSGPPGPHRVIFSTPDCFLAGEITSEGQKAGVYTECTEEF
ncbi:hypothetical protein FKW77_004532 [Venturia effusa]|uniref:ribonuclease T1 n=1 Tax=Venturia effusa TaxID=50376 RepID=A0A517LNT4_9PEZI|nr:hypothetical protein FKW77_004532 [Venturia effusa]